MPVPYLQTRCALLLVVCLDAPFAPVPVQSTLRYIACAEPFDPFCTEGVLWAQGAHMVPVECRP